MVNVGSSATEVGENELVRRSEDASASGVFGVIFSEDRSSRLGRKGIFELLEKHSGRRVIVRGDEDGNLYVGILKVSSDNPYRYSIETGSYIYERPVTGIRSLAVELDSRDVYI